MRGTGASRTVGEGESSSHGEVESIFSQKVRKFCRSALGSDWSVNEPKAAKSILVLRLMSFAYNVLGTCDTSNLVNLKSVCLIEPRTQWR